MSTKPTTPTPAEVVQEVGAWTVGGGIIIMALFPLALPLIILTVASVIPLLVAALALGLVAAVVASAVTLLRRLGRAIRPHRDAGRRQSAPPRAVTAGHR